MNKFRNTKKNIFIETIAAFPSLEDKNNDLTSRCKFNFSYFDSSQDSGQKFSDWNHKQLHGLLKKIKDYTAKPLDYWRNERIGKSGLKVLATYGGFPLKSNFVHPKHIPHQAQWGVLGLGRNSG